MLRAVLSAVSLGWAGMAQAVTTGTVVENFTFLNVSSTQGQSRSLASLIDPVIAAGDRIQFTSGQFNVLGVSNLQSQPPEQSVASTGSIICNGANLCPVITTFVTEGDRVGDGLIVAVRSTGNPGFDVVFDRLPVTTTPFVPGPITCNFANVCTQTTTKTGLSAGSITQQGLMRSFSLADLLRSKSLTVTADPDGMGSFWDSVRVQVVLDYKITPGQTTPVPLPAGLGLSLFGLAALVTMRRLKG
ncbi:MAG: VPLPA-CTERM sorting domain-containing protein [Pseudomonadota bacterium]